jgi:putative FmdB family regulatory protein
MGAKLERRAIMPMYEYRCDSCGKVSERYSAGRTGQNVIEKCPSCGKDI